jgi:hypothetical protein
MISSKNEPKNRENSASFAQKIEQVHSLCVVFLEAKLRVNSTFFKSSPTSSQTVGGANVL